MYQYVHPSTLSLSRYGFVLLLQQTDSNQLVLFSTVTRVSFAVDVEVPGELEIELVIQGCMEGNR